MPWKERDVLDERLSFVKAYESGEVSMAGLCMDYGISRPTGYKWVQRYHQDGARGLLDLSRAPRCQAQAVDAETVEKILAARRKKKWGPGKLRFYLMEQHPERDWPAVSTMAAILKEYGLSRGRRKRTGSPPHQGGLDPVLEPNAVWGMDFKGWFRTGDGTRCDPFTMTDLDARFLLRCTHVERCNFAHVQPLMEAAFRDYGLPKAIRTDNGPPFASTAPGGLSRLSIWLIRLGIRPERIAPGRPDQNGRHERFHRTLKEATADPPRATVRAQQRAFDQFRKEYNHERPHQALGQRPPASVYTPSPRTYPARLPEVQHPEGSETVRVYKGGTLFFKGAHVFLTERLARQSVGLQFIDERYWRVYFGMVILGTLDTHKGVFIRPRKKRKGRPKK